MSEPGDPGAAGAWGSGPSRRPASTPPPLDGRGPDPADGSPGVPDRGPAREPRYGDDDVMPEGYDTVAVLAVAVGVVGLAVFGLALAIVAGVLGATAGQRARESGRSFRPAYLAFLLAVADGVVWIVLHLLFELPVQFG